MSAQANSNRLKGERFRELVTLLLRADGLPAEHKPIQKLSVAMLDDDQGDIRGIPGWLLNVRNEVQRDLSGNADYAEAQAKAGGLSKAAVVYNRYGRSASEAYVVMTLATFSVVLRGELANIS